LALGALGSGLLRPAVAQATPPDHYQLVVTRTGFFTHLCAFPVRVDRPAGQTVVLTDFYDSAGAFVGEREQFSNFVNRYVNPANGRAVTTYATGNHTLYDLHFNAEGAVSYRVRTVGTLTRIAAGETVRAGHEVDYVVEYPDGDLTLAVEQLGGVLRTEEICALLE
jgi:hypothetical protein